MARTTVTLRLTPVMTAKRPTALSIRLRQMRKAKKLSQQQLATAAGLSMSMVGQIEQGNRLDPRMSTVKKLADALGTTVAELTRET